MQIHIQTQTLYIELSSNISIYLQHGLISINLNAQRWFKYLESLSLKVFTFMVFSLFLWLVTSCLLITLIKWIKGHIWKFKYSEFICNIGLFYNTIYLNALQRPKMVSNVLVCQGRLMRGHKGTIKIGLRSFKVLQTF